MNEYELRFRAVSADPLGADAAERLTEALQAMPGPENIKRATDGAANQTVSAGFAVRVRGGMADAARDGSRLAKEALKAAGMPDAQLIELTIRLSSEPTPGSFLGE
jgi:hypothetical protein